MANALEAAFGRQLKKHFPDDEDNSDEDFEEELMKKSKKKTKEIQKQKKPGYFVDNFVRDPSGLNRGSPNPPQLHNMAQAMPSMQSFFPNHLPSMNHMTGRGMMPPGHPSRFPYPPTGAHFGPDGRPMYPPQFYQNFNRGMSPYGMAPHPQYNQFGHMGGQMGQPRGMQGYQAPNAMMQGHMRFPPNARENSLEGYKKPESEQPTSPQLSGAAVSTSGEVTPSSETSDHHEPETSANAELREQKTEGMAGPGSHIRSNRFEQRSPETRPVLPAARPMDFGQQLPMGYGNPHLGPRGYFNPRARVPLALQPRPDGFMQRMPGPPRGRMPFVGVAGPYQQNLVRAQMPELKQVHGQNLPTSREQHAHDPKMSWHSRSPADINVEKHQGAALTKSPVDQTRAILTTTPTAQSAISPTHKHESEEEEVPFPFIIRSGQKRKPEDESVVPQDNGERKERHVISSSSENEQPEPEKQSPRKPLGFPISQLLNDPVVSRADNPAREPVRPGGQPSVIKSTAAATPSPTTHHAITPEDRGPNSEESRVSRSQQSRAYAGMEQSRNPANNRPPTSRGHPSMDPSRNPLSNRSDHPSRGYPGMEPSRNPASERSDPSRGYPGMEASRNPTPNRTDPGRGLYPGMEPSRNPAADRLDPTRGYPGIEASRNPAMYKDWPATALGGEPPRSFLEELNGEDLPPPRGFPEFTHGERAGADSQNHRLPFTSLLKEMAPPPMAGAMERMYSKPREPDRTDPRYGKNYTDRDSFRESYGPSRNQQLHSPQEDPRHANRAEPSFGNSVYVSEKRAPNMPPLYRASNGASQDMNSTGHPKDYGDTAGSNSVEGGSQRQLIDLDNVPYRRAMYQPTEEAYNREALFLANQRRQQQQAQAQAQNIPPSMSQIFPGPPGGQGPPMMSYSAMLRQQQLFEAAYASHMVRNGEYPMSRVEDGVPVKMPRFS